MATLVPNFLELSEKDKLAVVLCPISAKAAKLLNKFAKILVLARKKIDEGQQIQTYT